MTIACVPGDLSAQYLFAASYANLVAPTVPPAIAGARPEIMNVPLPVSITWVVGAHPVPRAAASMTMAFLSMADYPPRYDETRNHPDREPI